MWQYYQPEIIKKIFLPYVLYMSCMIWLASMGVGEYLDTLEKGHDHSKETVSLAETDATAKPTSPAADAPTPPTPEVPPVEDDGHSMPIFERIFIISLSLLVGVLWVGFFSIELAQIKENIQIYFRDVWNVFDFASLTLNAILIIMINLTIVSDSLIWEPLTLRTISSIAVWFLWIKTFYWMRLFEGTAYFITLIRYTIWDIKTFFFIVLLIMFAFANFFFIINKNSP
jgi:hypothetical protein